MVKSEEEQYNPQVPNDVGIVEEYLPRPSLATLFHRPVNEKKRE
jgi:hypothetical protein